jgi:PHD/YefM family antitoxin component YafN of YafNO toxin-antitoxin module
MDADDWFKTIEKKLQVAQCNNREKVLFASHQLVGPAADWWDAYVEAHEEPKIINWQEFKNSFHSHHVPLGVMKLKKEFEDLKQGSMSVSEYVTRFTQLSRYAPDNMDTNEKKQDWFLNGLNDSLAYALEARDFINFQDMVDKALVLENRKGVMERKRKMQRTRSQGSNTRFRVGSSSQRPVFRPGQQSGQPRVQAASQGFQIHQ